MASDKPLSFRVVHSLRDQLLRRVPREHGETDADRRTGDDYSIHQVARIAITRYVAICERHDPRRWLSRVELAIVCDVCNGTLPSIDLDHDELHVRAIWHEVADAIEIAKRGLPDPATGAPQLLARHCRDGEQVIDGAELVRKLQSASYADLVGLADFVERFWADDEGAHKTIYPEGAT